MKPIMIMFFAYLYALSVMGQKVQFSTIYAPLHIASINDTPNPTLIQADGQNASVATIAINATQSTAIPLFGIGRGGGTTTSIYVNNLSPLLNIRVNAQLLSTFNINQTNSFVGINLGYATQPSAQLEVNGTLKLGTNGTTLNRISKGMINKDVPTIVASGTYGFTLGLLGLSVGSAVSVSTDLALDPKLIIAYALVESTGFVTIIISNISTTNAVDPPAMNFYVTAIN